MVVKENSATPAVKWIGCHNPQLSGTVPQLEHRNVYFYTQCILGPLTLRIGDYVLVSNADAAEPDTVDGCDIAKILQLYELREMSNRDPCRAIVQWYSRPDSVPHTEFDTDDICIDFGLEIIEEHRPYETDISLETIFRKCSVIIGDPAANSAAGLIEKFRPGVSVGSSCPMFVCRYKFIKVRKSYRLVPLQFANDVGGESIAVPTTDARQKRTRRKSSYFEAENDDVEAIPSPRSLKKVGGSARKAVSKPRSDAQMRRRASVAAASVEFIDVDFPVVATAENKVSPFKIVGGRSVVRSSSSAAKKRSTTGSGGTEKRKTTEVNANYLSSPLAEQNIKVTPTSRVAAARRNLNLSLGENDSRADNTADSDCLNYSIVKTTPGESQAPANEMKIKLRLSERRRSSRLASLEEDPLGVDKSPERGASVQYLRKRVGGGLNENSTPNFNDIYNTPSKKSKATIDYTSENHTPSTTNRRKSILKSATSRLADGTPKRSIQLSNIVEKRIFQNNEIISTPKRGRARNDSMANKDDDDYSPQKKSASVQKTPTRVRNTPKKSQVVSPVTNIDDDEYSHQKKSASVQKTPTRVRNTPKKSQVVSPVVRTPSQKLKLLRSGEMAATIEKRQSSAEAAATTSATGVESNKSDLQLARERLHVSVVPNSLPCREKEFTNIYTFLEGKIQDQCGGCMYVSGVPGTGKTATVSGVIRALQHRSAVDELPAFEFLEINGMRLTEPRQAYVQIYKQLTGKTVSWDSAHSLLEKRFTTPAPRRVTTVLLVDELDILCNRRQDVVYNLLDWPTKSAARLVVVTIANTMDLPERLLMGKVTSRLGLTRLTFQPYTHKQLQEIVTARLGGSDAFKGDAVQLVARKVAAVSGDARRALDICRRATEIADASTVVSGKGKGAAVDSASSFRCVNMLHVQQALSEMIASAKVQSIKNCSCLEQIFLQAVVAEVTRTGVEETSFMSVYIQIETIAAFMGVSIPTPGRALRICSKLAAERLLIGEHSRNDIFQKILLNVSVDDVHYALRIDGNA